MTNKTRTPRNPNHNPDPQTARGKRRRQANHPGGINEKHPAWVEGGYLCNKAPKEKNESKN
jgi:hypothetical protein